MAKHEVSFNERLKSAAKARQTMLTTARANAPVNGPGYAERQAKPMVASIAREKRREEAIAGMLGLYVSYRQYNPGQGFEFYLRPMPDIINSGR